MIFEPFGVHMEYILSLSPDSGIPAVVFVDVPGGTSKCRGTAALGPLAVS